MPTISEIEKFFEQKISYENKITIEDIKRDFKNIVFVDVEQKKNKNSNKKKYSKKCKIEVIWKKGEQVIIRGFYKKQLNIIVNTKLTNIYSVLYMIKENYTWGHGQQAIQKVIKTLQKSNKKLKELQETGFVVIKS